MIKTIEVGNGGLLRRPIIRAKYKSLDLPFNDLVPIKSSF